MARPQGRSLRYVDGSVPSSWGHRILCENPGSLTSAEESGALAQALVHGVVGPAVQTAVPSPSDTSRGACARPTGTIAAAQSGSPRRSSGCGSAGRTRRSRRRGLRPQAGAKRPGQPHRLESCRFSLIFAALPVRSRR
jgi:hypothetical protein